jgi:hypothetical protein
MISSARSFLVGDGGASCFTCYEGNFFFFFITFFVSLLLELFWLFKLVWLGFCDTILDFTG